MVYIKSKLYVQLNCYKIAKFIGREKAANISGSVVSNLTISFCHCRKKDTSKTWTNKDGCVSIKLYSHKQSVTTLKAVCQLLLFGFCRLALNPQSSGLILSRFGMTDMWPQVAYFSFETNHLRANPVEPRLFGFLSSDLFYKMIRPFQEVHQLTGIGSEKLPLFFCG